MDLCRGCMVNSRVNLLSLRENEEFLVLYNQFTSLTISLSDGLPNFLCTLCVDKLNDFKVFKQTCLDSNFILKENLNIECENSDVKCCELLPVVVDVDVPETTIRIRSSNDYEAGDPFEGSSCRDSDKLNDEEWSRTHLARTKPQSRKKSGKTNKEKYAYPFKCDLCQRGFRCEERFLRHMLEHEVVRTSTCLFCNQKFATLPDLQQHTVFCHKGSEDTSGHCVTKIEPAPKTTKQKYTFPFKCTRCERGFKYEERLLGHMREHEGYRAAVCEFCNREYTEWSDLQKHIYQCHQDEIKYICNFCGKKFIYESALETHKIKHSGPQNHICEACGKSFAKMYLLNKHKLAHTDKTPFECGECGKKFKSDQRLKTHQFRHTGIKKYVCKTCGKGFTTSPELRQHASVHSDKKEFQCTICQQMFKQRSQMSAHRRSHIF